MLLSLLLSLRAQLNGNHDRVCLATVEPRAPRHERRRLAIADVAEKNSISHVLQGKTPARRTHICQGCPFGPLLVRRTVSDEFDTKEGKIQLTFRFAICSRSRSSFSRASGVKFSPKSVNSYTGRISTSDSPGIGFGQRFNTRRPRPWTAPARSNNRQRVPWSRRTVRRLPSVCFPRTGPVCPATMALVHRLPA